MLGPTRTQNRAKKEKATSEHEGKGNEHNLPKDVDDYKTTFQLQFYTPKGPVIQSPTYLAPTTGGSSHQGYATRKVKTPIEVGISLIWMIRIKTNFFLFIFWACTIFG